MLMINLRDGSGKKTAIYSHITIQGARRLEMKKNLKELEALLSPLLGKKFGFRLVKTVTFKQQELMIGEENNTATILFG